MNRRLLLLTAFILLFTTVFSQSKKITVNSGTWTLTQYASNIIKVSFLPKGYITNENISDAVIKKPQAAITIPYKVQRDGAFVGNEYFIKIAAPEKDNEFYSFAFRLHDSEKIFGGGERALPLNRRGYQFNLYNGPHYGYGEGADNLNYSVPFFTSSMGYGLFFDNPSKGYVDIGKTDANIFKAGFVSGELNVYVILGNDYKAILSSYYQLTGTQPLPPRWAFGNLMSRFGYTSEAQVKSIIDSMHQQDIPVDAVIFDLFWFGDSIKQTMGNLAWVNKDKWPNPTQMLKDFRKQNINPILITEPYVVKSSLNYDASKQYHAVDSAGNPFVLTDFYFGNGGLIDIFRKDARAWFWSKYKEQMNNGVEAWWGDLGEPERHPQQVYHNLKDLGFNRLFKADEVHNAYGNQWTKMLYEYYAKEYPAKRLFSLNRSGFAGTQRYGIFPWTGDVSRSWSGLRAQLPVLLGMSMSGVPYVHSDAGGFAGGEGDNELYVRWLQFAAFTPIFRPHGTDLGDIDKNSFSFPSEAALIAEPYRMYASFAINLRYSLLPYNYTLAYSQAKYGEPLMAPLYYYFPKDTTATTIADEFMWGKSILVAPVLHKGDAVRNIYLPEGKWYRFNDTGIVEGNKWTTESLSMDKIPVYAKEGSIIPMWASKNIIQSTHDYDSKKDIKIFYYPSQKKSSAILYDDDGTTKNVTGEVISFNAVTTGNKLSFTITTNKKSVYQKGLVRKFRISVPCSFAYPMNVSVNGVKLNEQSWIKTAYQFNQHTMFNSIEVQFKGDAVTMQAEIDVK
ncbi:TIM-barrel domain-containing protein [Ferruginibacter albus]|uniref:TIM-barrel domain-containing protein n=1 Tax=Ferruginibacter albus TaxID=2875540 RepID=UPI001CC630F6|nr:TIM-barrel domain-containing protein [Ferruginibacter albus]UAY52789.1 hypothetical protein K9M53_03685 [Ferruginibacter albus]